MKVVSRKIVFCIFILSVFCSFKCKKAPTLLVNNPLDPESPEFSILPPSSLRFSAVETGINLRWIPSESNSVDGYIIYRSLKDTIDFEQIAIIESNANSFIDEPEGNPITLNYKIVAYYDQEQIDNRILSKPLIIESKSELYELSAFQKNDNTVEIFVNHNFTAFSEFTIQQRIGKNSSFEFLQKSPSNSNTISINYDTIPTEEITYRVFVENEFEKTDNFETFVYGDFWAPIGLKIIRNEDTEVEISLDDSSNEIDEYLLYEGSDILNDIDNGPEPIPIQRISGDNNSIILENLESDQNYFYSLKVRKGGAYSSSSTFFEINNDFNPRLELSSSLVTDGSPIVYGDISSDGMYAAFTLNEQDQYLYNLNNISRLYKKSPYPRAVSTDIFELNEESFFHEFTNSGTVNLRRTSNNSIFRTVPPIDINGGIQAIDFIDNTNMVVVFSNRLTQTSISNKVGIYDLEQNRYIDTLISNSSQNHYQIAHSGKSIITYEIFSKILRRFSISDFSFLNEIDMETYSLNGIEIEAENDPELSTLNTDYYIFRKSDSREIFRLDLKNSIKKTLRLSNENEYIKQFHSTSESDLKCVLVVNTFEKSDIIECSNYTDTNSFTFKLETRITGFLISPTGEFIIIFTNDEIRKYSITNSWALTIEA